MASLSLPRVLQLKKNSVDAEREQFEKFQTLAIQKAINAVETPVKEKHVRSTIIGTFQEQSAITYWMVAIRLPLQDNRIVAWKFCHVTHKLLREGHPACLDDSQRHIGMIENLGKLWVHLREGYGKLVHLYCALLVCKLKFHARNPRFPGNMNLTSDELDAIAENDVNNYFQICVELFDYMEDILNLQAAVFDSLGNARANSMTASGQCRLAALIPCAQDSSQIYDCNVRLLFRLHAALPPDTLAGHRERFRQQFKKLSSFYKHASSLQYYRNLLSLPVLPSNPPNFLVQSDFGTYVTPVVSIPEPPADEPDAVGSLIDTSDTVSQVTSPDLDAFDTRTPSPPQPDPLLERDRLIDHLQNELRRTRQEISQMVQERNSMLESMREHCMRLESQLQTAKTELVKEKEKAEVISAETPEIKQKLVEVEEKAKVTDEKFQKLKGAYTQLREEHINLIRQKAEVDKLSATLRAAAAQHESAKMSLQQQLNDKMKDVELLQQSASSTEEIDAYKSEISNLRTDLEASRQKEVQLETLKASMESLQIEHKTASTESEEKINILNNELVEVRGTLESVRKEKEARESEMVRVKEELVGLREKSGEEYNRAVEEKEAAVKRVAELTEQYQQEKQEHINRANNLQDELDKINIKLTDVETNYATEHRKWLADIEEQSKHFQTLLFEKDSELKKAFDKIEVLQEKCDELKNEHDEVLQKKQREITQLQEKISSLMENKDKDVKHYEEEKDALLSRVNKEVDVNVALQKDIEEKEAQISSLTGKVEDLVLKEEQISRDLVELQQLSYKEIETLKAAIVNYERNINDLQNKLSDQENVESNLRIELKTTHETISKLEITININKTEIDSLKEKISKANSTLENHKSEFRTKEIEYEQQISQLRDELIDVITNKEETVHNMETVLAARNNEILCMRTEIKSLRSEVSKLEEDLNEREAELEIGKNELLQLKEEHQTVVTNNDNNLAMKNQELRSLNEEVNKLYKERNEIVQEKENKAIEFAIEKQVLETKISTLESECNSLRNEFKNTQIRKDEMVNKLNEEVKKLSSYYDDLKDAKEKEIRILNATLEEQTVSFSKQAYERDNLIQQASTSVEELKSQIDDLKQVKENEIRELEQLVSERDSEKKMLESRLGHIEKEKLSAECELQDLLQHNHSLEDSVAALRQQLEDARKEAEKNRQSIVTSAGAAALEVTNSALASLERASTQDSNKEASRLAAKAFRDLASGDVKGKEESVAQAAVVAAHNAAQLSAYVTEVSNGSTDLELADKLTIQCRTMLQSTKQCMESIRNGTTDPSALELSSKVTSVFEITSQADRAHTGTRSVDDELADMDAAIETAAGQIEEMLRASRAADSGVKLEVNGKILDACTTLMGAVKILVQDARRLQNELGDPTSRMKMYRRNPQWSEGLISAAKAVVFAAKLLVTSADEAVGAAGRVEGVSAAAHEVAGSTAQLVAASRARAPPASPSLARLTQASRSVAAATGAVVAAVRAGSALVNEQEALDTSALSLTATRRLEMESKVRALELESALDAERARLAALRRRHYQLAQTEENNGITNGK